jgi:hypothetical protein
MDIERLAQALHKEFRSHNDLSPPWSTVHDKHRERVMLGLRFIYSKSWATQSRWEKIEYWLLTKLINLVIFPRCSACKLKDHK